MNRRYKNSRRFFTLLEVLVSMGVFTILMLALMQFFSAAQTVWEKSGNRTETYESARMVCQMLREDLSAAFYGDEAHDMSTPLQFFGYQDNSGTKDISFATERDEGLTMVNYRYYPVSAAAAKACSIYIKKSSDSAGANWITKNTGWLTDLRNGSEEDELLKNVVYFDIKTRIWSSGSLSGFAVHPQSPSDSIQKRPPPQVYITIGVVSEDALEKIARSYGKMGALNNDDNRKAALETIMVKQGSATKSLFDDVFDTDPSTIVKANSNALDGEGANQQRKRWLLEGTQFFNILVHIDR